MIFVLALFLKKSLIDFPVIFIRVIYLKLLEIQNDLNEEEFAYLCELLLI